MRRGSLRHDTVQRLTDLERREVYHTVSKYHSISYQRLLDEFLLPEAVEAAKGFSQFTQNTYGSEFGYVRVRLSPEIEIDIGGPCFSYLGPKALKPIPETHSLNAFIENAMSVINKHVALQEIANVLLNWDVKHAAQYMPALEAVNADLKPPSITRKTPPYLERHMDVLRGATAIITGALLLEKVPTLDSVLQVNPYKSKSLHYVPLEP